VAVKSGGGGQPSADGIDGEDIRESRLAGNVERLVGALMQRFFVDRPTAIRWIRDHLADALEARGTPLPSTSSGAESHG
jgi:hypothetical protein